MPAAQEALPATWKPGLQFFARWLIWPLGLSSAVLAAWLLSRHPDWALPLQMATMVASVLLVVLAERAVPMRQDWRHTPALERRTDLRSMAVLMTVADPLIKRGLLPLIASVLAPAAGAGGALGWFPSHWPLAAQVALAAAVAEFGQYWMHRASHSQRFMWGVHGFHHQPSHLYWLNGFRVNPLNMVWHQLAGLGVLVALGTPAVVVQMLILIGTVVSVFQHANADLRYGGWNRVLGTADLHRWHHATGPGATQANFGTVLMLWDQLFGTYRREPEGPRLVGVDTGVPLATGYLSGMREAMHNARRQLSA